MSIAPLSSESKSDWKRQVQDAIRDPETLFRRLQLPMTELAKATAAARDFPVFAPESYVARMESGNVSDPLLRQVLPVENELESPAGFSLDPVGDQLSKQQPGLIQKYRGRVLLITTGMCAIHCRYCFRRHYAYDEEPKSSEQWEPAVRHIENDKSLQEVILSGGDPLSLSDGRLSTLLHRLGQAKHLRRIRVHTRLPIVIPDRVTEDLIEWLTSTNMIPYLVLHANHANELSNEVVAKVDLLRRAGIILLNQAVLLRGVNDSVDAMAELCEKLSNIGVLPYYLNQLDRVKGAAHFEVPVETGKQLIRELQTRLPGYAVPRFVQEIAGAEHKVTL